jgi:transcription elongation factor Elf1
MTPSLPRERAERIARAHACVRCQEYSYRRVRVDPATPSLREALGTAWQATLVCGVCGTTQELGIDDSGDVVYVG